MLIKRRQILKTIAMGSAYFSTMGLHMAQAAERRPTMVFLTGVGPSTPASEVFSVLDPVVSQNIPVGLIVRFVDDTAQEMAPDGPLADLLRGLIREYGGLVEIILHVPGLAGLSPYFQMRRASEARALFAKTLGADQNSGLSIATEMPDKTVNSIAGMRSAGFRNVVLIPQTHITADYWETEAGVLQISGGTSLPLVAEPSLLDKAVNAATGANAPAIIFVALDTVPLQDTQAFEAGAKLGDFLAIETISGNISPMLPLDAHARSGQPYKRMIGLRVDQNDSADPAMQTFIQTLEAANVPFTLASPDGGNDATCLVLPKTGLDAAALAGKTAAGGFVCTSGPIDAKTLGAAGVGVVSGQNGDGFTGLDRHGLLHLPVAFAFDGSRKTRNMAEAQSDMLAAIGTDLDAVIAITPAAVQDPAAHKAISELLGQLHKTGALFSLEQFHAKITPDIGTFTLLQTMRHDRSAALGENHQPNAAEAAALLEDATSAWKYFERLTDKETGLCPGSVDLYEGETSAYPFLAMWDVASQIMALTSAHSLKILDDNAFMDRIKRLLAHIPTETVLGLRFPPYSLNTDKKQANEPGLDASDMGRLLTALRVLETHSGGGLGIPEMIAGWDIAKTIKDGRLHSIRRGRMKPLEASNYMHYAVRGYALWGFEAIDPYNIPEDHSDFDADIAYLDITAHNGLIGTEPHALEAVEMGHSAASRTLADTLYSAQLAEHAKTGSYVCVSEGTLNRDPWFTYQGYQIGTVAPWQVSTVENSVRHRTAGFQRATAMTNTKAAYLWAAVRPQAYSQELVEYIRQHTKIEGLGFVPGVFTATGIAMPNYADINTNGIILQSIAYILNGRKPLIG